MGGGCRDLALIDAPSLSHVFLCFMGGLMHRWVGFKGPQNQGTGRPYFSRTPVPVACAREHLQVDRVKQDGALSPTHGLVLAGKAGESGCF